MSIYKYTPSDFFKVGEFYEVEDCFGSKSNALIVEIDIEDEAFVCLQDGETKTYYPTGRDQKADFDNRGRLRPPPYHTTCVFSKLC